MLRWRRLSPLAQFTLVVLLVAAAPVAAQEGGVPPKPADQPSFTVVPMGAQGRFGEPSVSRSNANGTAIGTVASKVGEEIRNDAFIQFRGAEPKLLARLPGQDPSARVNVTALNDNDWAVGHIDINSGGVPLQPKLPVDQMAVAWPPGKEPINLGVLAGDHRSTANAINNRNQIVGYSDGGGGSRAFLWESGKGMRELPDLGPRAGIDRSATAQAISGNGHVAGHAYLGRKVMHAVLWTPDGKAHDLGELPGGTEESAAVTDGGQVVGYGQTEAGHRAFLWTREKGMVELGSLPNWPTSIAYGVNGAGWVVGSCRGPRFGGPLAGRPFLWTPATGLRDLNDLLDPEGGKGWTLTGAARVNDRGEIEASGTKDRRSYRVRLIPKAPPPAPAA